MNDETEICPFFSALLYWCGGPMVMGWAFTGLLEAQSKFRRINGCGGFTTCWPNSRKPPRRRPRSSNERSPRIRPGSPPSSNGDRDNATERWTLFRYQPSSEGSGAVRG